MKKIITGIKSTGSSLHLGNLMGAVLPFEKVAKGNDAAIFIADLHSLTSVKDGDTLRHQTFEIAVEYLAIYGVDTPITIFRQSDIHDITKLMWILTNVTPYSLMNRAHSFKDFQQKKEFLIDNLANARGHLEMYELFEKEFGISTSSKFNEYIQKIRDERSVYETELQKSIDSFENNLNMGVFNYPILMAADIIGYDVDAVPVGEDQIQHLEMTRDIVRAFNKTYSREVFKEPEAVVPPSLGKLPGIDGRKMSKSYDNFIGVFDDEKVMKKRVMSIVTDSKGVDEAKDPDTCNVFALYNVFASADQTEALRVKYLTPNGGFGYGHAKTALLEVLIEYLRPYREAREKLLKNPEIVEAKLTEGATIMNARLDAKMELVKRVVGVN